MAITLIDGNYNFFIVTVNVFSALRTRIEHYFLIDEVAIPRYRREIMKVVRALVDEGEIARHRVRDITGKGATVAAEIIKDALAGGWIESPSPKGPLRIAFPAKVPAQDGPRTLNTEHPGPGSVHR